MEQKLYDAASKLPEPDLDFYAIQPSASSKSPHRTWRTIASLAACFILLITIGFVTVEAKEYTDAVNFFNEYGLSTDGLSRDEIKAVYRDITTKSFTYSKTAQVIASSISADHIGGYEIIQENPTPEYTENLWNCMNSGGRFPLPTQEGIHYQFYSEYVKDPEQGFSVHDKSFLEKYDGDTLLWSISFSDFRISGSCTVSDGVIAYGETPIWSTSQDSHAWMAKISPEGKLLWKCQLDHGFGSEYIAEILENPDGSYAVFSRGLFGYLCLSQFTADGKELFFQKSKIGDYAILNAARFADGYLVQLGTYYNNDYKIVKVDRRGNLTESFTYGSADAYYYITDMIEFNGSFYLSAYAVPKLPDEDQHAGGRYEIAGILNYLFENRISLDSFDEKTPFYSSDELTQLVRDNYTAVLLVCDPAAGTPREFYSVKGSLGGKLSLNDSGMLLWDVESIADTFYSPYTSSFSIGGSCHVFRYTFDLSGKLVSQEKTGEVVDYRR